MDDTNHIEIALAETVGMVRSNRMYPAMSNEDVVAVITRGLMERVIDHERLNHRGLSEEELRTWIFRLEEARDLCPTLVEIEEKQLSLARVELIKQQALLVIGNKLIARDERKKHI